MCVERGAEDTWISPDSTLLETRSLLEGVCSSEHSLASAGGRGWSGTRRGAPLRWELMRATERHLEQAGRGTPQRRRGFWALGFFLFFFFPSESLFVGNDCVKSKPVEMNSHTEVRYPSGIVWDRLGRPERSGGTSRSVALSNNARVF